MRNHQLAAFHAGFAVLAAAGFVAHLLANFFVEEVYWLPEYVWGASLILSGMAIYTGCSVLAMSEGHDRGRVLASVIVGTAILLGLIHSGITWLFVPPDVAGVAM